MEYLSTLPASLILTSCPKTFLFHIYIRIPERLFFSTAAVCRAGHLEMLGSDTHRIESLPSIVLIKRDPIEASQGKKEVRLALTRSTFRIICGRGGVIVIRFTPSCH